MSTESDRSQASVVSVFSGNLNRTDLLIALGIGLLAILVYGLALAPDMLYSDSGEFQTLAYTWGTTHPTGYPVYLLFARIASFVPLNSLAWRVSFFSALAGGFTLGTLFLLARCFTSRGGAMLSSLVLLLSYTFWSQSIIAEVYTPATALISLVLLVLLLWQKQSARRPWLIFVVGLIMGLGVGVHLFMVLIGPAVAVYLLWGVLWGPPSERRQWSNLLRWILGGLVGLAGFYLLFAFMDSRPTPTSFYATTMIPSQDAWNLGESDLDTTLERFWISVSGVQWRDAMLPQDANYNETLATFFEDYLAREYTVPSLILAVLGLLGALLYSRRGFALIVVALLVSFIAGLVYHPGDKYIFYLPVYMLIGLLVGIGAGFLVKVVARILPQSLRLPVNAVLTLVLIAICTQPFLDSRWRAVQTGQSRFVDANYTYPVRDLEEPRRVAECAASKIAEDDAYLVLNWRALYSIYYVTHVEQGRTGIVIREARPHGTQVITDHLMAEIRAMLDAGTPVYVDEDNRQLRAEFTATPVQGDCRDYNLFTLSLRSLSS